MRKLIPFLLLSLPILLGGQDFILIDADRDLFAVDVATCETTFIVNVNSPNGISVGDITFTPDGTLWGLGTTGTIFTIDQNDGSTTLLTSVPQTGLFTALVADAAGLLYIANDFGDLYTFNPATGELDYLGDVGPGAAGDLTFVDGQLVMASVENSMIAIDLDNPANSTTVLNFFVNSSIFGIVTFVEDCDNTVTYATSGSNQVFEINFEDNSLTELCDFSGSAFGAASSLEFLAATPIQVEEVNITNTSCAEPEGIIEVIVSSGSNILYSLDGINFQSSNTFSGLEPGIYTIFMQDDNNCMEEVEAEVLIIGNPPVITAVNTSPALCGESSGSLEIEIQGGDPPYFLLVNDEPVMPEELLNLPAGTYFIQAFDVIGCRDEATAIIEGTPPIVINEVEITACGGENSQISVLTAGGNTEYTYQLNGGPPQTASQFNNLPAGTFTVMVEDSDGCSASFSGEIPEVLQLEVTLESLTACGTGSSFFSLSANGGNGNYAYSLNGGALQSSPLFENISPGVYSLIAEDEAGCRSSPLEVTVPEKEGLLITDISTTPDQCGKNNGSADFEVSGGTPPLTFQLNGQFQTPPPILNLTSGPYALAITDADGCLLADTLLVSARCPIYIPGAFSPNEDGRNDRFEIYSGIPIEILSYQIFNRWGGLVYEAQDFSTLSTSLFWDGTFEGTLLNPGLYVYSIQLINGEGVEEQLGGEVILVR
jgi:gliding motility-associated-like protein